MDVGWWHGQSHGELTALSGVCGLVASEVFFSTAANSGSIMVVKCKASPRVGKFGEIMLSAVASLPAQEQFVGIAAACICMVCGIRSSSHKPRQWITIVVAGSG